MKTLTSFILIGLATLSFPAFGQKEPTSSCCVDFNKSSTFISGTIYRNSNDSITSFCRYETRTDKLIIKNTSYYNFGRLENAPPTFGAGQVFNTNNITLKFTAVGIAKPVVITFDYLDMGGTENLSINGKLYSGELEKAPATFGKATVTVTAAPIPLPARGITGTVTITGIVKQFKIGGQEFYLDNVCFADNPEEKTAAEK